MRRILTVAAVLALGSTAAFADNMINTDGVKVDGNMVTVPSVMADQDGYVVIHAVKDGAPVVPASIGHASIKQGENTNVMIESDYPLADGEDYLFMLHDETNGNDTYDFGAGSTDVDTPTMMNDEPVTVMYKAGM